MIHLCTSPVSAGTQCRSPSQTPCSAQALFNLCGHGFLDLSAYEAYLAGRLQDYEYPAEKVAEALKHLPKVKG